MRIGNYQITDNQDGTFTFEHVTGIHQGRQGNWTTEIVNDNFDKLFNEQPQWPSGTVEPL